MKNILKLKNILVLIVLITFFSCENNVEEESGVIAEESCDPTISFTASIKSIIDNNCIQCHGGNRFPDLRTHQGISNSAEIVKTQVVNRTMPQGGSLTNDQIEMIRCWIESGALNN
ncbi:cytochrome c [uncultured Aquimarina sp.]|uniref:c-type cytochrome n=1 Tax=uncultured Aquimarina sp. TaxID=575652 RepID=UPI002628D944|nr:cytochrome c [uncultured Aquimarina sp.]